MLSMKQIESSIAAKVDAELPYDAGLYLKAVNEGIPVLVGAPASAPGRALAQLAALVSGFDELADTGQDAKRGGLFGGLRRRLTGQPVTLPGRPERSRSSPPPTVVPLRRARHASGMRCRGRDSNPDALAGSRF